jgi:N-glycosylase/DNA lyase
VAHPVPDRVDLEACLFGGQAFTWWSTETTIEGLVRDTRVSIDPETRTWTSNPEREPGFLAGYLGRERAQPDLLREDPDLGELAARMPGLRLLDQDPWEAFLAFLISPANHVPRIQATIAGLCRELGPAIEATAGVPGPRAIASAGEAELRERGLGFRAPRVEAAAQAIVDGELSLADLAQAPIADARARLVELDGVGPKVAECVLCYALGFDRAFPVDRWVARAGERLLGAEVTPERARQRWGPKAAIAQQVIFHGARKGLVDGIEASPVAGFDAWRSVEA